MYREHGRNGRNECMTLKQMDNPQGHIPSNACERALAGDIFRYGLPAGCAAESVPREPYIPVSYTHLDVYKRQLQSADSFSENAVHLLHDLGCTHITFSTESLDKTQFFII